MGNDAIKGNAQAAGSMGQGFGRGAPGEDISISGEWEGMGGLGMGGSGMGGPGMGGPGMGGPGMGGPEMGGPGMGGPGMGGSGMGWVVRGWDGWFGDGMGGSGMGGPGMGGPGMGGPGMGGLGMGGPGMGPYEGFSHGGPSGSVNPVSIGYYAGSRQSPMYEIPVGGFQIPAGFRAWGDSESPSLLRIGNVKYVNTAKERAEVGAVSRAESVESGTMRPGPVGVSPILEAANAKSVVEQNQEQAIGNVELVKEGDGEAVKESSSGVGVNTADKVGTDPNVGINSKGGGEGNGKLEQKADSKKKSVGHAKRLAPSWNNDTVEDDDLIPAQ
ncbi:hypothetical protein EV426DRAFT_660753 [Tirmania nivea]|nr:hypothetical protein EV426DRAFT_660753 [Tirmania nivea]